MLFRSLLGVTRPTLYDLLEKHKIGAAQFGRKDNVAAEVAAPEPTGLDPARESK